MTTQGRKGWYDAGLDDPFPFGKYQGRKTVREVLQDDPKYMTWALGLSGPEFKPEVKEAYDTMKQEGKRRRASAQIRYEMGLESDFEFGKYIHCQVEDVIEDDPSYIAWCCEQDWIEFDNETLERIAKRGIA